MAVTLLEQSATLISLLCNNSPFRVVRLSYKLGQSVGSSLKVMEGSDVMFLWCDLYVQLFLFVLLHIYMYL